jgi:hypothetical protein
VARQGPPGQVDARRSLGIEAVLDQRAASGPTLENFLACLRQVASTN